MRFKQLDPDMKQQRRAIVLLLRFRTVLPSIEMRSYETYAKIARISNLDYNSVQHICKQATQEKRPPAPKKFDRQLEQEHIDFLTSEFTLVKQAGLTLVERCEAFEQLYPPKRLCATRLRRIYLKHKIRRKAVRKLKAVPVRSAQRYQDWKEELVKQISMAEKAKRKFVYVDEVFFSKSTVMYKAYSHRLTNLAVDQEKIYLKWHIVIAGVSEEKGVEHLCLLDESINQENFKDFLRGLRRRCGRQKLAVFMDNLRSHKT